MERVSETIRDQDYGSEWPLTVSEATLHCERPGTDSSLGMVWVEHNGFAYPINGTALSLLEDRRPELRIRDIKSIWSIGGSPGSRVNIGPLIDDGLELC